MIPGPRTTNLRPRVFRGPAGERERAFVARWCQLLWAAMAKTGNGYPRPSQRRTGKPEYDPETKIMKPADRRADKRVIPADPTRFEKWGTRSEQQARSCAHPAA